MDKIFSARIDETIVSRIATLANRLQTSKKTIIEHAIELYADKVEEKGKIDILDETFGAWRRKDSADAIVEKARQTFRKSMTRFNP